MTDFDFIEAEVVAEAMTKTAFDVVSDIYSQHVAPCVYAEKVREISKNGEYLTGMLTEYNSEHRYDKNEEDSTANGDSIHTKVSLTLMDAENVHYDMYSLIIAVDNGEFSSEFFKETLARMSRNMKDIQMRLNELMGETARIKHDDNR